MSSSWIDPFFIMRSPFLFLETVFVLKSIMPDISTATSALFWLLFAWYKFFHSFIFSLCLCIQSVSLIGRTDLDHLKKNSANSCLWIGVLNPLIFNAITGEVKFRSPVLQFVFYMPYVFFGSLFHHYCLLLCKIGIFLGYYIHFLVVYFTVLEISFKNFALGITGNILI